MGKRAAEAGAGMVAGGKAAALLDHVDNQEAYRQRVRDSHAAAHKVLTGETLNTGQNGKGDGDVGSRIIVTGDVYGDRAVEVLKCATDGPVFEPAQPPALPSSSLLSKALPYVLAATLGAGGTLGAASLAGLLDMDTDTTRRIEIEKYVPK